MSDGPPPGTDDRCEDFDTEPGVHYHAHDLPRCRDKAVVGWGNPPRWICQRHLDERLKATRSLVDSVARPERVRTAEFEKNLRKVTPASGSGGASEVSE